MEIYVNGRDAARSANVQIGGAAVLVVVVVVVIVALQVEVPRQQRSPFGAQWLRIILGLLF